MDTFRNIRLARIRVRHDKRFIGAFNFMFLGALKKPAPADCRKFLEVILGVSDIDESRLLIGLAPLTVHMLYEKVRCSLHAKQRLEIDESKHALPVVSVQDVALMITSQEAQRNHEFPSFTIEHSVIMAVFRKAYWSYISSLGKDRIGITIRTFGPNSKEAKHEIERADLAARFIELHTRILTAYAQGMLVQNDAPETSALDFLENEEAVMTTPLPQKNQQKCLQHTEEPCSDEDSEETHVTYSVNLSTIRHDLNSISHEYEVKKQPLLFESGSDFYHQRSIELWKLCPLTNLAFEDPVIASDGITYEREAIESWSRKNSESPTVRGHTLQERQLRPNCLIRQALHSIT